MRQQRLRASVFVPGWGACAGWLWRLLFLAVGIGLCLPVGGCKRSFYRRTADRDAYCLVSEKGVGGNWDAASGFSIEPDPRSRFYDPTCPTDPRLPMPAPQLYNYTLPELSTPPPAPRQLGTRDSTPGFGGEQKSPAPEPVRPEPAEPGVTVEESADETSQSNAHSARSASITLASFDASQQAEDVATEQMPSLSEPLGQSPLPELGPIPAGAWNSLPESCLRRMLEFDAVRAEYQRTFEQPVTEDQLDPARRVNLANIVEIALINSREYQTRRETLYRVALRLSFQRFDYDLKFLSRGNGTGLTYTHDRSGGIEVNRLAVPTEVGITRALYTGGDLVARFANDVVLTFNGTNGYSSSIGSELFIDLFQPILQRDIQFEPLTQAERDVVYAARDFVRFQKVLFRDLATQYYGLLLTYRGIAINTQDYFSNLREFNRAAATQQAGRIPLFQVDQFEQNVLRSRGNVINSCNALEGALDRLKLRIGLPTEMPLNVALSELEELTLLDEASVLREQLDRKTRAFAQVQASEGTAVALPSLTEVARRLLSLAEINAQLAEERGSEEAPEEEQSSNIYALQILVALLEAEEKRIDARQKAGLLAQNAQAADDQAQLLPAQLLIRHKEVVLLTLEAVRKELLLLQLLVALEADPDSEQSQSAIRSSEQRIEQLTEQWTQAVLAFNQLDNRLVGIPFAEQAALIPGAIEEAIRQQGLAGTLERTIVEILEQFEVRLPQSAAELDVLVAEVMQLRAEVPDDIGLAELEIDMDEAMLTALVQRLDLMNRRGALADAWRQIKYAGDDLRSILNIRATQSIRTRNGSDNPFDFTFDDSTTRLSLDFDTPLNRRGERNVYRLTLINYNVALRNLIEAQDTVKLDIRDDLRAIALDRNQYEIAIASAALAYDRVTSTRLQVALGQANITARDFLEAQQAYTQSLSSVAQQHIGYIQDRIQLFLNLEQLQVNEFNFWPELRNESYPFIANTNFGSLTPDGYGSLPPGPWYSDCMRRMERVPSGVSTIYTPYLPASDR